MFQEKKYYRDSRNMFKERMKTIESKRKKNIETKRKNQKMKYEKVNDDDEKKWRNTEE